MALRIDHVSNMDPVTNPFRPGAGRRPPVPAGREPILDAALAIAGGYPYFLQAVGKHVWDAARTSTINLDDVHVGGQFARREVDEGLYRSRWERATAAQRQLLRTLGELGGDQPVAISDLATAMGKR